MSAIKIEVVRKNVKDAVYCGRPGPLGNPFWMPDESHRDRVCDQFDDYFDSKIINSNDSAFFKALGDLEDQAIQNAEMDKPLRIGCFCAPKRCHLDTVRRYLLTHLQALGHQIDWQD